MSVIYSTALCVCPCRYGLRAPVYLKDRSGLVAQPAAPATDQHSGEVTFNSGEWLLA